MISPEAAPLAKTGGLADVAGALPAALQALGDQAAVVMPRYASVALDGAQRVWEAPVFLGPARYNVSIYQKNGHFPFYLVDCPRLYDRPGVYGEGAVDY